MKQPELPYEFFTDEQKYYLDQLTKFAGRTQRSRVVSSQAKPSKKYTFIKNNFTLMTADEQYEFNDADLQLNEQSTVGSLLGFGVSVATMIYYIARKPLHAKLYGEMAKSFVLGLTVGQIYYQYHNYLYREKIHEMYVRLLVNKKLGKI